MKTHTKIKTSSQHVRLNDFCAYAISKLQEDLIDGLQFRLWPSILGPRCRQISALTNKKETPLF